MVKRRSENWVGDELLPRIRSKATFGATVFWLAIWGITSFEPWVGFGLFFAWAGSVGLFGGKKDSLDDWDEDDDDDHRYGKGGETDDAARARFGQERLEDPAPPLHRQVIAQAAPSKTRLEAAASVAEGVLGESLRTMLAKVRDVESGLESDPSRLSDVQRLFTYYLPATADLLTARGAIARSGDTARLVEIDTMIGKLALAYNDFAERLKGHDARSLEIDLRLLDRALNEEFTMKSKG